MSKTIHAPRADSGVPIWYLSSRSMCALAIDRVNPGWFTSVMGTGIVALCAALLPMRLPVLHGLSVAIWLISAVLMAALLIFWLAQSVTQPQRARASLAQGASAQMWGAPAISCFTIATGFLVIGTQVMRPMWAVAIAEGLWLTGAIAGTFTILAIPYMMMTRHQLNTDTTYGTWLLPVVPAVIASVPGGLLVPHLPLAWQSSMLVICYALWGMGMMMTLLVTVLFYSRLMYRKVPAATFVPTMWIVVGPLGVSVAGLLALCRSAQSVWPLLGSALRAATTFYGLTTWGFAIYWLALAMLVTLHAVRLHMPFSLGWWSFTFPVGVLITGTFALYARMQAVIFLTVGIFLCLLLAALWVMVSIRTLRLMARSVREAQAAVAVPGR